MAEKERSRADPAVAGCERDAARGERSTHLCAALVEMDQVSVAGTERVDLGVDESGSEAASEERYDDHDFHQDGSFLPPRPALMISTAAAATQCDL